ncbi:hypothetical protein ACFLYH_01510 [Candidatus Dependentiae bacterium]
MKKYIKILFLLFTFLNNSLLVLAESVTQDSKQVSEKKEETLPTFFDELCDINLNSFKKEYFSWSADSMEEYLRLLLKHRLNPRPVDKRDLSFNFFKIIEKIEGHNKYIDLNEITIWKDLDLFCGKSDKKKYVANSLNRTNTEIGTVSFYHLLSTPIYEVEKLIKRQEVLKNILNNKKLFDDMNHIFLNIEKPENILLSLFWQHDYLLRIVKQHGMFSVTGLKKLNNSDTILLLRNIIGHIERANSVYGTVFATAALLSFATLSATNKSIVPDKIKSFLGMGDEKEYWGSTGPILRWLCRIDNRWIHTLILLAGGTYCGLKIKDCTTWFRDNFLLDKTIHTFSIQLAKFMNSCKDVYQIIKMDSTLYNFEEFEDFISFFEEELVDSDELKDFFELCESGTFKQEPTFFFMHKGKAVKLYSLMHKVKEKLLKMIAGFARVDAYLGLAKLYKEFEGQDIKFSFVEFAQSNKPFIEIKNFWHPLIDKENIVTNSIVLGKDGNCQNVILTGPNAGGKSIALKSIVLSVLMAHTFGIVPAKKMILTPFNSISTYLNITDDAAMGQSLFKAEVLRCQKLINKIEQSSKEKFHFQVFDEIFNGTTPREGMAAAYGVAQYLGNFENSICLIATHFSELTLLEKETNTFDNYKVSVDYLSDNSIKYPYKLEKGISNQYVAFDILKSQGFAGSILDNARSILN